MTLNELINELSAISRRMSTGDVPLLINSQPIIITEISVDPSAIDLHVKIDTNNFYKKDNDETDGKTEEGDKPFDTSTSMLEG